MTMLKDILSIVGSLITLGSTVVIPLLFYFQRRLIRPITELPSLIQRVETLTKEMSTNGGSSMKDIILSIKMDLKHIIAHKRASAQLDPRPIFETDKNGQCVWVNRAFLRLVGLSIQDVMNHGWKNILCADDLNRVVTDWEVAVRERREYLTSYRIVNTAGQIIRVSCQALPMLDEGANLFGYIGFLTRTEADHYDPHTPAEATC